MVGVLLMRSKVFHHIQACFPPVPNTAVKDSPVGLTEHIMYNFAQGPYRICVNYLRACKFLDKYFTYQTNNICSVITPWSF